MINFNVYAFLPAIDFLFIRLQGQDNSRYKLLSIRDNLSKLNEAQVLSELLTLDFMFYDYSNEQSEVWDIQLESFSSFYNRSEKVKKRDNYYPEAHVQSVFKWMIMLCDDCSDSLKTHRSVIH
ncbi:hypothetical protein HHE92_04745 [Pseudoalteromonas arctica]|jgi:hypothetical protein|uniref:hypothetical protein n=1 Tax=Pseudoalteromonas arctica TaxID=394751 RepID=UPI00145C201C|nr:hypothetical protein [Pseudoalteromonas arctica]NMP79111.1 hypothetical protein [Pseudoalteromonas arctica]